MPVLFGSLRYGSYILAVLEPSEPSMKSLRTPISSHKSPRPLRNPRSASARHSHVAVVAAQEYRPVGHVLVQQGRGPQLTGESTIMVPVVAEEPAARRQLGRELPEPFAELRLVARIFERDLTKLQTGAQKVQV